MTGSISCHCKYAIGEISGFKYKCFLQRANQFFNDKRHIRFGFFGGTYHIFEAHYFYQFRYAHIGDNRDSKTRNAHMAGQEKVCRAYVRVGVT